MKKILAALVLSLAVSVTAFAKEEVWQYNQFTTIDMSSAKISYPAGMQTLTFHTVEKAGDSTDYCTYVYNVDEQTIQLKEMVTKTKKSKYKSSFFPNPSRTAIMSSRHGPAWPMKYCKKYWKNSINNKMEAAALRVYA